MKKNTQFGFGKSLLVISTTIIVLLLICEIVLRFGVHIVVGTPFWDLRRYIPDEELCWAPNPGYYGPNLGCKKVKSNRFGFRGIDYSKSVKDENTLRLMLAGDSNTAGWALQDEEKLFPRVLERG